MDKKIAILMAAGLGTRMRPITNDTPKPLVKVNGVPMIETVIKGLTKYDIDHIYVVVGYKKEQFSYLADIYPNLTLIENKEYDKKNNISSLKAVGDILGSSDCFICEADLLVSDYSIFDGKFDNSLYFGRMVKGYSDDWVFELNEERISRVGKGGYDCYNMVGISYFKKEDARVIKESILDEYNKDGHEKLFWDEIVEKEIENIYVGIKPVTQEQIIEIDTCDELAAIDDSYNSYKS